MPQKVWTYLEFAFQDILNWMSELIYMFVYIHRFVC
jgi:hypothetical protein